MFFRNRSLIAILGITAALIAFSRIYLGVHYLSDVAGGLIMGNFGAFLMWTIFTGIDANQIRKQPSVQQ